MDTSNELIRPFMQILHMNTRLFLSALSGIGDADAARRIEGNTNNVRFISFHLLEARYHLARYLGIETESPFHDLAERVKTPEEAGEDLPTLEGLRLAWEEVSHLLESRFQGISEEELSQSSPDAWSDIIQNASVLGGIAFLLHHESHHIGQLAFLRRALGLEPLKYS
jgi:uncharacterized damage-inducible protein DinB